MVSVPSNDARDEVFGGMVAKKQLTLLLEVCSGDEMSLTNARWRFKVDAGKKKG